MHGETVKNTAKVAFVGSLYNIELWCTETYIRELRLFPVTRVETTRSEAVLGLEQLCKIMWLNVRPHTRGCAFFVINKFVVTNFRPRVEEYFIVINDPLERLAQYTFSPLK